MKTVSIAADAGRVTLPNGQTYVTSVETEVVWIDIPFGASGTYTLTHNAHTTTDIDVTATPAEVEAALVALTGIAAGDIVVRRGTLETDDDSTQTSPDYQALLPLYIEVTAQGILASVDDHLFVVDDSDVVGGEVRSSVVREVTSDGTVSVELTDEQFAQIAPSAFTSLLTDVTPP